MSFLRSCSDQQILSKITELVDRERALTRDVLLHLNEIERRKLHLKLGYASMFDYCTTALRYSSSAAARRIRTARCISCFPEVLALLEANEVNLSTVSQISRVLTPANKGHLLQRIRGKSQREVDAIVAELEPRATMPPDRVKTIVVKLPAGAASGDLLVSAPRNGAGAGDASSATTLPRAATAVSQGKLKCADELHAKHCRSGSEPSASQTEAITSTRMLLSFSVSEEFMAKMEQVRSIAWHRLPASASLEQVFQFVMEYFVAKEDPCVRREKCNARQEAAMNSRTSTISYPRRTRRIAAAVMGEVFARDEGRCTYIGASGKRCDSTRALQVDHITPFALGGKNLPGNLRLLCAYHNRLEAERLLGHPQSKSSGEPFR